MITSPRVDPAKTVAIVRRLRGARGLFGLNFAEGPCGGPGRRARLKIEFRKECWFDSGQGHHLVISSNTRRKVFARSRQFEILCRGRQPPHLHAWKIV